ncbi:conserved hypothetical protein [Ixodes scapularis]|uniref:Uncharacterized protein n=1 Tax=Ixodes scapularis TaxID=6945 RepID=B7P8X2_IXOSC|nr:conserved hypothetical protein [Ixodes scapularis]|eukprot:XP_002403294.1 conserved hypothetical protein [Ixodes scapularis]
MEGAKASKYMGEVQTKGAGLVPKRALKVMDGEVNRVLILGQDCIVPVPYQVPRKDNAPAPVQADLSGPARYGSTSTNAPPPASRFWFGNDESVLEQLRQAREHYQEQDPQTVASAVLNYCLGTSALTIKKCPHEPMIPVVLVVGGALALLSSVANIVVRSGRLYPSESDPEANERKFLILGTATGVLNLFMFAFFILGCVVVYGSLWPSKDPNSTGYCSPMAFYFAFWFHNAVFIFIGFLLFIGLLGMICGSCFC